MKLVAMTTMTATVMMIATAVEAAMTATAAAIVGNLRTSRHILVTTVNADKAQQKCYGQNKMLHNYLIYWQVQGLVVQPIALQQAEGTPGLQ